MKHIILFIFLFITSFGYSSENKIHEILVLEERLDGYQRNAVISAIPNEIISLFEIYFKESTSRISN